MKVRVRRGRCAPCVLHIGTDDGAWIVETLPEGSTPDFTPLRSQGFADQADLQRAIDNLIPILKGSACPTK